ncbi:hypothetical protein LESZY_00260 [Brevundimonas phage vB_BpoS-Leszy]|nr:hypothetical protein LESZY_00260 [Brevundimonas phage vB_BpoS-Leszy]USN16426.1 hypothetical protein POLUDNITSA_00110 [Brevundimonas phage vB_BpoS-Poludnitsa]
MTVQTGTQHRTGKNPTNHWRPFMEVIGRGKPSYMIRFHLTPFGWWKWRRAYLHILGRPDADREYHDHPWSFWTLILFGGYTETSHVMNGRGYPTGNYTEDRLGFLSVRKRPATHAHLITKLHTRRVVTLVLRDNEKAREWGFWSYEGASCGESGYWRWIPWKVYHGVNP